MRACGFAGVLLGIIVGSGDLLRTLVFAVLFQVLGNVAFVAVANARSSAGSRARRPPGGTQR